MVFSLSTIVSKFSCAMTSKHKVLNRLYASKLTRNEYGQSVENAVLNHNFLKRNGEQWKQFLLILLL